MEEVQEWVEDILVPLQDTQQVKDPVVSVYDTSVTLIYSLDDPKMFSEAIANSAAFVNRLQIQGLVLSENKPSVHTLTITVSIA